MWHCDNLPHCSLNVIVNYFFCILSIFATDSFNYPLPVTKIITNLNFPFFYFFTEVFQPNIHGLLSNSKANFGKIHRCSHCSYSTFRVGDFKRHILIHSGVKPYKCHICKKGFVQKNNLSRHLNTHTMNQL